MGCVTNWQYQSAASQQAAAIVRQATVDAAIQAALALWQRNTSRDITNMQMEIAERQIQLAEAVQAHAEEFWPAEKALVTDTFGETRATEQYEAAAATATEMATQALADGRRDWLASARQQCLPPTRCEDARFQRSEQMFTTDMMSFAVRQEEARTQEINDRRYERQYKVLQIGRGRLSTVAGFQSAALRAGASSSSMLFGTINSALEAFGYYPARNNPGQWGYGHAIQEVWGVGAPYSPADPRPQNSISPRALGSEPFVPGEMTKGPSEFQHLEDDLREMRRIRGQ